MPDIDNSNEVPVKVAVRIRPLTNRERLHKHQPCVKIIPESNQIIIGKDKNFTFDYVLPPKTTQSELYLNCVDSLVKSIFEGYNATVFAYGQTGSGKTFTINGNIENSEEVGIIPRAVKTIFDLMKDQKDKQFTVKVSYLEIYKDDLKDLLDATSDKDIHIREDEAGNVTIHGANEINCFTLDEVMHCFESGSIMRHTGSTNMNEQSSRSHSIFSVFVEQRWSTNGTLYSSSKINDDLINDDNEDNISYLGAKFHFVDLAGSERVGRTGNVGDRFKESIHINSGLLALGNVISALSSNDCKKKHIPYRDSKITRLLKDSLGGNAKTLMICCISPSSCNLDESINAVKYASRARFIRNKPIINMDPQTQRFVEMQGEIKALRDELQRQRTQLQLNNNQLDEGEYKQMENRLIKSENEATFYKRLVKDASIIIREIVNKQDLDLSLKDSIEKWLENNDNHRSTIEVNEDDFSKQKIFQLEAQLKQAYNDLKSDEEIFCDKEKEIADLKEKIKDLESSLSTTNRYLEASYAKEKEQQELMVQLQIQIDKLIKGKAQNESRLDNINETGNKLTDSQIAKNMSSSTYSLLNKGNKRAKTAPNVLDNDLNKNRQVFSSPAIISLEKVMQTFRARTQLLTETMEENDNVMQKRINECDLDELEQAEQVFVRRGTFSKPKEKSQIGADEDLVNALEKSSENRLHVIKESEVKLREAQQKMRDLNINIKMKEELIKELVANSKLANRINYEYQHRIENLQKECAQAKNELQEMQQLMQQLSTKDQSEKAKFEIEYKKKYELAQQKILELEMRQKDTTKFLNITNTSEKRIQELELTLGKMRQQQEILQKKLKEDSDKKLKLEKDLEREQQKIKELNARNEQQQKILKKKTEDLANAQRKLRTGSALGLNEDSHASIKSQHWVEQEMEKIIQEKRQLEQLKDELDKREKLVAKKEILLAEKNELQIKKLRSSRANDCSEGLKENLSTLIQQRKRIDERLNEGNVLSTTDERRLIEIEEAIEAIETAIEFENESIAKLRKSQLLYKSNDSSENIIAKLSDIPPEEAKHLIRKFFHKIIDLKENERKKQLLNDELQVQLDEKTRLIDEYKKSMNLASNDLERRLIIQQKQYEKQINVLMGQLNDCTDKIHQYEKEIGIYKEKIGKLSFRSSNVLVDNNQLNSMKVTSMNSEDFNIANESLKSSTTSQSQQQQPQMTTIKLPKKGLRPLSEDELAKRSKKV